MPERYLPEFRSKVLALVASDRRVTPGAADLDISDRMPRAHRRSRRLGLLQSSASPQFFVMTARASRHPGVHPRSDVEDQA